MSSPHDASTRVDVPPHVSGTVVPTTNPRSWIALTAIIVALVIVAVWSVTSRVPQQIRTEGVISASDSLVEVLASDDGAITYVVPIGAPVSKGDVLAVVSGTQGESDVVAPVAGQLQQRDLIDGSSVRGGQRVARIERTSEGQALTAVAYLTLDEKSLVTAGTPAVISIPTSSGAVVNIATELESVSGAPSTVEAIAVDSGSLSVAESVIAEMGGFSFRAAAPVVLDAEAAGANIGPGTLVQFTITYAKPRPIDLLFGR